MAYYITILAQALAATAIVAALWPVVIAPFRPAPSRHGQAASGVMAVVAGVVLGTTAIVAAAGSRSTATLTATLVHGAALLAAAAALVMLSFSAVRFARKGDVLRSPAAEAFGLLLVAVLAMQGAFEAWRLSADHALTSTDVINTELIANGAAIVIAIALLAALAMLTAGVARLAGRPASLAAVALVLSLLLVVTTERVVLNLLRLDAIAVTPGRVSFVAKLSLATPWLAYGHVAAVLGLVVVALFRRSRMPAAVKGPVERRRSRALILGEGRLRRSLAFTAALLLAVMLYQDLYASRPPSLSAAAPVAADGRGAIRIPAAEVKDGKLHRFAYVSSDGHRVRFFLINRYDEAHVNIGVVYDACMICGDEGYIQRGDEIICIACNVRIFRPSIGKPGGCNPIPLDHAVEDGAVVIAAAELEKGARYFSEVVEIEVEDPVSGRKLINLDAPHRYDFEGRTYFFESRETWERFRAAPQSFIAGGGA